MFLSVVLSTVLFPYLLLSQEVWETVYLVQYGSGVNIWDFYHQLNGHGEGNKNTGLKSIKTIARTGNFRSSKLNDWKTEVKSKVRLALYNDGGGLLWHMTFNSTGTDQNPDTWLNIPRLLSSTDESILDNSAKLSLVFNSSMMLMEHQNGKLWLHASWLGLTENGPQIAFSGIQGSNRANLPGVPFVSNSERIKTGFHNTYTNKGENYMHCFKGKAQYLYGIGVGKLTTTNYIKFVSFSTSLTEPCYSNLVAYRNSDCEEEIYRPDYSTGTKQFFPIATTPFRTLAFNYTRFAYNNEIYFFIMDNEFVPTPILTIQWLYDHGELVQDIQKSLSVDKMDTSLYKRQQTSATDDRGSVLVFGLLGLVVLLIVVLLVIMLDIATLGRHFKMMKYNTKQFRHSTKTWLKRVKTCFKKRFSSNPKQKNAAEATKAKKPIMKPETPFIKAPVRKSVKINLASNTIANPLASSPQFTTMKSDSLSKIQVVAVTPSSRVVSSEPHSKPMNVSLKSQTPSKFKRGSLKNSVKLRNTKS